MKVTKVEENRLEFDNGLVLEGDHAPDCCENNYLDFEQIEVGDEFPDIEGVEDLFKFISFDEDGFTMRPSSNSLDVPGMNKWVQARSVQNGYYSRHLGLSVEFRGEEYYLKRGNKMMTPGQEWLFEKSDWDEEPLRGKWEY